METTLKHDIRVFPDPYALAIAAASFFAASASGAIVNRGIFSAALPGGSTPRLLFRILESAYRESVEWNRVHLFWTDERAVPPDHEQSNYRLAYEGLISKIAIPSGNIHRIRGELNAAEAALEYERDLRRFFKTAVLPRFDLVFLGLGQDGHTASLFQGSEALSETMRLAVPSFSKSPGNWRVTLTLPVLNNSSAVVFLVSGRSKAGIASEILAQNILNRYPAGMIKPSPGKVIWLLDREAANSLKNSGK